MKVLVTGANGMVGKNLVERLIANEHMMLFMPRRTELDLLDKTSVFDYMHEKKPDFVVHLAAKVGGIQANMNEPVDFLVENNLMNTYVIMGAVSAGVTQLLNLGSSCMYPRGRDILHESDMLTGELEPTNEGYALAKVMAARLCQYITKSKGLTYKTIVPCNIYGRYDHFDAVRSHMVPAVIRKLHEAKIKGDRKVSIWGDGESRREFMYVEDLIDFLVWAMPHMEQLPDMINVGLGVDYSINEYYQVGAEMMGYEGLFTHDLSKPAGMRRKMMDVSKSLELGWRAKTSLQDGMKQTYEYYLNEVFHG
jgi:GDP-L-fucose synthase